MSDQLDSNAIISGKENLSHVEKKSGSNAKPVFRCQDCEFIEEIPTDTLEKMANR